MWAIPDQPRKSEDTLTTDIRKPPTMWRPAWRVIQLLTASMLPRQLLAPASINLPRLGVGDLFGSARDLIGRVLHCDEWFAIRRQDRIVAGQGHSTTISIAMGDGFIAIRFDVRKQACD